MRLEDDNKYSAIKKYSLLFAIFFMVCYMIFLVYYGKSLFMINDGRHQHYIYFLYVGVWIRELFSNLFVKHVYELPMWDMSIGMGGDAINTGLTGFSVPDPFYWISAITPLKYAEAVFDTVIVAKWFFSGICFVLFASYKKYPVKGQIAGALVYVFSTASLGFLSETSFIDPFIILPLILLGFDRLRFEGKVLFYVIVLAISTMNSYYFTFMIGVYTLGYYILSFITESGYKNIRVTLICLGKLIFYTILGVGVGLWCTLPTLVAVSGMDRFDKSIDIALFSFDAFKRLFCYSFSGTNLYNDYRWGCSALVVPCYILLLKTKDRQTLRLSAMIMPLLFLFPPFCAIFSAMLFPTDRCIFGLLFVVALSVASSFDNLSQLRDKLFVKVFISSVIYLIICSVWGGLDGLISSLSMVLTVFLIWVANEVFSDKNQIRCVSYYCVLLFTCLFTTFVSLIPFDGFQEFGKANDYLFAAHGIGMLEDKDFRNQRFDYVPLVYDDTPLNSSCILRVNGYDFYHSTYNQHVVDYFLHNGVLCDPMGYNIAGLRGRTLLELQNASRYILHYEGKSNCISAPYSYEYVEDDGEYALYQSRRNVSMIYFYDETVSYDYYDHCDPFEKEELMMSACVLENCDTSYDYNPQYNEIVMNNPTPVNVTVSDGLYEPDIPGGYLSYSIEELTDNEIGVYLQNLNCSNSFIIVVAVLDDGRIVKYDMFIGLSRDNIYYHDKDDLLFDFGMTDSSVDEIRVYFYTEGQYTLDSIYAYSRRSDQLDSLIDDFYDHADMSDVNYEIGVNRIDIDVSSKKDQYLFIAVPYSEGWSATVDGEDVEIMLANEAFMAVPVSYGEHDVHLVYRTPYLLTGIIISVSCMVILITAVAIKSRIKNKALHRMVQG